MFSDALYLNKKDFFNFVNELLQQLNPTDGSPYQDQLISHLNGFAKVIQIEGFFVSHEFEIKIDIFDDKDGLEGENKG